MRSTDNPKLMILRQYANDAIRQFPMAYEVESIPNSTVHLTLESNKVLLNFNTDKNEVHDEIGVSFASPFEKKPEWKILSFGQRVSFDHWADGSWLIVSPFGKVEKEVTHLKYAIEFFIEEFVSRIHNDSPPNLNRSKGRVIKDLILHKGWIPLGVHAKSTLVQHQKWSAPKVVRIVFRLLEIGATLSKLLDELPIALSVSPHQSVQYHSELQSQLHLGYIARL